MAHKQYELIKDTPAHKAGTVFTLNIYSYFARNGTNAGVGYTIEIMSNLEWFKPIGESDKALDELFNTSIDNKLDNLIGKLGDKLNKIGKLF